MTDAAGEKLLARGWAALAAAEWEAARLSFEAAPSSGEALDGLADAADFLGEHDRAIELKERAFAAYRTEDRPLQASAAARALAFLHATCRGNFAVASGWVGRAQAALEGLEECAAHGWVTFLRAPFSRDLAAREAIAAAALTIARRFGDADLEFDALTLLGETHVAAGRVEEGMRLLDQAMAAVAAGEVVGHGPVGEIYCRLLSACEHALDVRRAEEWMASIDCHVAWTLFVRPTCRTHYGGILVARGDWPRAEEELLSALRAFDRGYRGDRVYPLVRLADLRVRQGRYEEAELLLEGIDWHPVARRAAATIALARGDLSLATGLARLCFEGADRADPACAPLLALVVEIALRREDADAARAALDELAELAEQAGTDLVQAYHRLARGQVAAVTGAAGAAGDVQGALEAFAGLALPWEAARAQLQLARVIADVAPEAAAAQARLALSKLQALGATADADAAAALLRELGAGGRAWPRHQGPLTRRETEVLSLLGAGLSNADIAHRLVISRRTAEHHVASILAKLGVPNRSAAAAHAVRAGLEGPVCE
jgi:DNA-binding CsgD family transcriptional regulator